MAINKCLICRTEFSVKPSHLKRGWGKYCSIACRNKSQLNGKLVNCYICNDKIYRTQKDLKKSKSNKFFCGKRCQTIWRNTEVYVGKNHTNWVNGEASYRKFLLRIDKERICLLCKSVDSRTLIVHHIDKNRENNSLENLVWLCLNCHYLVHHFDDEHLKFMKNLRKDMVAVVQK